MRRYNGTAQELIEFDISTYGISNALVAGTITGTNDGIDGDLEISPNGEIMNDYGIAINGNTVIIQAGGHIKFNFFELIPT
jgi:hypothetical protein